MGDGYIDAVWVGPAGHRLSDGTGLEPGVTVCRLSEGEATESDNWQPVKSNPAPTKNEGTGN
jgi:hypothetical protein